MNCCKCHAKVKTPLPEYTVQQLVEICRCRCICCDPERKPKGGRSQVESNDYTLSQRKVDPCANALTPSDMVESSCRGISPDAFDRLRTAMTALFALNQLDLLIVQHIANGGKYSDIERVYINLMQKCKRYHGSARQMVYARKNAICVKLPFLKPMIDAVIRKDGKDAAVRRDVEG